MKRIFLMITLIVCMTHYLLVQSRNVGQYQPRCGPEECLPELPRNPVGMTFRGQRYPGYYQGYPYYGVYNYGSYRGRSWGI